MIINKFVTKERHKVSGLILWSLLHVFIELLIMIKMLLMMMIMMD